MKSSEQGESSRLNQAMRGEEDWENERGREERASKERDQEPRAEEQEKRRSKGTKRMHG